MTRPTKEGASPTAAELVRADQEQLIHPLHHPVDNRNTVIYVRGRGVTVQDVDGNEYIDGLSGLWNVNVGHGRAELAEAAAAQMRELAYFSGFVGSSNIPSITLADRLLEITDHTMQSVFLTSGGAEANESAFKTARFYWKACGKAGKVNVVIDRATVRQWTVAPSQMGAERLERTRLHISQRTVTPVKKMPEVRRRPQVSHGAGPRVALLLEHVCKAVNVWSARAGT